jgi:hypothetical protein
VQLTKIGVNGSIVCLIDEPECTARVDGNQLFAPLPTDVAVGQLPPRPIPFYVAGMDVDHDPEI